MNRHQRRASESVARKMQRKEWDAFKDVTIEAMEKHRFFNPDMKSFKPDFVFQNNKYVVFVQENQIRNDTKYLKVMCRRNDAQPVYSWNDLYRIKNELFGEETEAVQFMPPKSELCDVANLYWFWIPYVDESPL